MMRSTVPTRVILSAFVVIAVVPASARQSTGIEVEQAALRLRPGQHVWAKQISDMQSGPIRIVISLPMQMAYVYRDKTLIGASTISTGKPGKETPVGEFTILEKRQFHRSNLYSNAPMPFMQRLTWDGIALHGGELPGYPASHGCIRLPMAFARRLFQLTERGARVAVLNAEIAYPAFRHHLAPPKLEVGPEMMSGEQLALTAPPRR